MNYNFNPCLPEPLNCIHPLQLPRIQKFLENGFPSCIQNIIVFGSSIDLTCHPKSDIDFYVIHSEDADYENLRDEMYRRGRSLGIPCDFIYATREDFDSYVNDAGTVEYDAYRDGVCIYSTARGILRPGT